jgi:hypothetical protein
MQAQVVHQRKATLPLLPMLLAALFVFATVAAVQIAIRDRGTNAPEVSTVDSGAIQKAGMVEAGVTSVGGHGAARIKGEGTGVSNQKAGMAEAGITNVSGMTSGSLAGTGGPHPRTKFAGSAESGSGDPNEALQATIDRIEQAR